MIRAKSLLQQDLQVRLIDYLDVSRSLSSQIEQLEDLIAARQQHTLQRRHIVSAEDEGSLSSDKPGDSSQSVTVRRMFKFWLQDLSTGTIYTAMEMHRLPLPSFLVLDSEVR
jgi:RecQ mediated genome instability protein